MSTKKNEKTGNGEKVSVNIFQAPGSGPKEIAFEEAVMAIANKHESDKQTIELQADAIKRLSERLHDLEAGLRITWHNNRPDTVGMDATAIAEYAKKYLRG